MILSGPPFSVYTQVLETWIEGEPKGAKSLRRVDFTGANGRVLVSAATTWAMLDRETLRPLRVRAEVLAPFRAA